MKKEKKFRWMIVQSLICSALLFGTITLLALMADRKKEADTTPPVITFPDKKVEYTLGDEMSVLLDGVTARDETDGDVTSSVRVRTISISEDNTKAVVSYVARDQKNNIALEKRIVDVMIDEMNTESETEPEKNTEPNEQS